MFEAGHPHEGKEFYAIQNMPGKTSKLSATNPVVKDRIESSFGRIITIFLPNRRLARCISTAALPPTPRRRISSILMGHPDALPPPTNRPIGEHLVRKLIKSGLKK